MTEADKERRLLVLAPTGRDALLTCDLLARAGLGAAACADVESLCTEINVGCAGILLAEDVMRPAKTLALVALLNRQPSWSDLPVIVFTGEGTTHPGLTRLLRSLGNVTVLDRPVRPVTMISSARAAVRARRRQYQARAELAEREQAVRHRDEFLAMLGHELRNPLSALRLATELIVPATEEDEHRLDVIERQAGHLARLVDELLDVARVTSGKVSIKTTPLALDEIASRVVATLRPAAERAGLALAMTPSLGHVKVIGDSTRLEQVITNLLGNAIKYTPAGGHVTVSVRREDDEAELSVKDDGPGLTPVHRARIFELFAQVETSLDRSQGGLGIGLTLARSLVELHGGALRADSDGAGTGSTFTMSLPCAAEEVVATSAPEVATTKKARHRVVLVEDNDDVREMTAMLMTAGGHKVDVASDGEAGARLIIETRPDIAFVDVGLPLLDGFEVARRVRVQLGSDVLLVALTGYGQPEDQSRAFDAGFDLHMVKPVDTKNLRRMLALERPQLVADLHAQADASRPRPS